MAMTEGDLLKVQGMARASSSEERDNPGFTVRMLSTIHDVACTHPELHIDLFAEAEKPQHPNCLGSVWAKAIKMEWIEPTGEWRKSAVERVKHARKYPVYRSKIYVVPS